MSGTAAIPVRKERLDKFLFFSRALKSRTLAQKVIETGAIRVNSERTVKSDLKVGAGDVLTMLLHNRIVIWRILDCGVRRGPAPEAALLYEDISPAPLPKQDRTVFEQVIGERVPGSGRPTKKERRETDKFRDEDE